MEFLPEFLRSLLIPHFKDMKKQIKIILDTDFLSYAKRLRAKTYLLWGTQDSMLSVEDGYLLSRAIENSELVEVAGGSHSWIILEPDRLANYVHYYLSSNKSNV